MSDDRLERATRALREEGPPSEGDLAETRARLLAGATSKRARRANVLRWVLPMAAAFAAGSAFAATNGGLERAVRAVQTWLAESPAQERPTAPPRERAPKPSPMVTLAPATPALEAPPPQQQPNEGALEAPATPPVAPLTDGLVAARGERRAHVRAAREQGADASDTHAPESASAEAQPASDSRGAAAPGPSPDLALYREAHRAHFTLRDYAAALGLWQRYLASFPRGIFALEAGYNRAICLVRLGHRAEAAAALRPFAEGQVQGGYRRDEARALLEALTKKP